MSKLEVILCFGLLLVVGITPGEGAPRIDINPSRPWLPPQNNWGQRHVKKQIPCTLFKLFGLGGSKRCKPSSIPSKNDLIQDSEIDEIKNGMDGTTGRKLDPNRPYRRPEKNIDQEWRDKKICKLLRRRGQDGGKRCKSAATKNDPMMRGPNLDEPNNGTSGLAARKLDSIKPYTRPESSFSQGWRDRKICKLLRSRGQDGGKRCKSAATKNDPMMRGPILDEPNDGTSGLAARKLDSSQPYWLRQEEENNKDQGWKSSVLKPHTPWKPARPPWMKRKPKQLPSVLDNVEYVD